MTTVTTARKSARKAKGDGHLRREEILQAAERIFVAEGYDGATIRRIADEVGVSSTALYMHFPDKSAILLEISRRTFIEQIDRNSDIAARPIDAACRVRMMLEGYMRWAFANPNAYQLVFSGPHDVSAVWHEATGDLSARCYAIFSSVVRELAAEGRLRTGTADSASQVLWASCHGVVALVRALPAFDWASRDELMTVTLDSLLHGLLAD